MAAVSDMHVPLPAAYDRSVVMTASFTSMLLSSLVMAAALAGDEDLTEKLTRLPDRLGQQLPLQQHLTRRLGQDRTIARFVFLGIGPFFGLACEGMLKMKEMTQQPSEAYSPLEFRHGPLSVVGPDSLVVLLSSRRARAQEQHVGHDVRRFGAMTLTVGSGPALDPAPDSTAEPPPRAWHFPLGESLSEPETAVLSMPLLQLLAFYRAAALGYNPDQPRHLTQVVLLDEKTLLQGASG